MKVKTIVPFIIILLIVLIILGYSSFATQQKIDQTSTQIAFSTALYSNSLTESARPTKTPFIIPKGNFEMSWDIYDSEYNTLGGILTIRKQGSKYTEKIVMSDGSSAINDLTVISEGSEIKLTGHLGITSSLYGDYMAINSDGWLVFYDSQGYIYGVPPLK